MYIAASKLLLHDVVLLLVRVTHFSVEFTSKEFRFSPEKLYEKALTQRHSLKIFIKILKRTLQNFMKILKNVFAAFRLLGVMSVDRCSHAEQSAAATELAARS